MNSTQPSRIRIVIIDDHSLFRECLARRLADEQDFEIVGACASLEEAFSVLASHPADIVLLDLELGGERGTAFFEHAREIGFQGRVLIVAAAISHLDATELVRLGAAGFFLKVNSPELLARSIRQLMNGELWLDQRYLQAVARLAAQTPAEDRKEKLSERERAVLRGILEGLLNKEIAQQLNISEGSVKAAVQQLFEKAGVRTRGRLVRVALEKYRDTL